jgi:chitodextrinase
MSNRLWFRLVLTSFQALGCAGHPPAPAKLAATLTPVAPVIESQAPAAEQAPTARPWAIMEDGDLDGR